MFKNCRVFGLQIILLGSMSTSVFAQTTFTSTQSGDWDDGGTWGMTSPGTQGTDWPATTDNAVLASGFTVTLTGNETINDFTINSGGIFDYDGFNLNVSGTVTPFVSVQTGQHDDGSAWLNSTAPGSTDRIIIVKGHTITTQDNTTTFSDVTIDAGAVMATKNNKDIAITSNLVVNGTLKLNNGNADLRITASTTVSGSGTIDGSESTSQGAMQVEAATTISSGATLTFFGDIDIYNGITLTNNGDIIVSSDNNGPGDITGANASSQLTMGTDSDIEINGTLMTTGILDASTNSGNTVEYNGTTTQTITSPSSNTYYSLTISGTSTKTFPANALIFDGNLTVTAGTLDVNSQNITIAGDWSNSSTISNLSTVTFNGTTDQSVTTNATNYVNVTVNKGSGNLTLNEDITVTGTLTMTTGNINTGANSLTLGSGSEGTFTYTAGRIIGTFGRYIATTTLTQLNYPIGTSSNDRTVALTFDDGGTGGGRSAGIVYATFVETDPGAFASTPLADDVNLYNTFNEGYWDFTVNGFAKGNSRTFDLALTGDGLSSFTIGTNTRVVTRATSGSDWAVDGTHNTVSTNTVSRNDITTFVAQSAFGDDTNCTGPSDPTITGSSDVCTSDVNDTYSVTLNSGNDYNFTVVGGTIDEAGGGTTTGFVTNQNSITVDWGSTGQVGTVSVVERNSCTSSNTVTLNVNINSIAPASISGNTLVAEGSTGIAYSVTNDANTTYTWTITGGTQASGTNTNSITVDWGSNGTGTVAVTATKTTPSCSASASTQLSVTKYIVVDSNGTGDWNNVSTWATGAIPLSTESARILSGHTVTLKAGGAGESISNLIVNGILDMNARDIDVSGDLTINSGGSIAGTGSAGELTMSGSLSSPQNQIDGTGSMNGAFFIHITTASKTIASTAILTFTGTVDIASGLNLSNSGTATFSGTLDGLAASSSYTTGTNSTTTFSGTAAPMATGTLDASTTGSTVVYSNATGVTIKAPTSSYYNLETSTGTQTLGAATDVNGSFTLTSGTFAMGANNMTVAGDLTYTAGTLTTTGTITLDGAANQTVSGAWTIPNLTMNNTLASGDAITLSSPITVSTVLTLTDGIVGTDAINILRMSTTTAPTGFSDASFINGPMVYDAVTTGTLVFPVGSTDSLHRADLAITSSSSNYSCDYTLSSAAGLGNTLAGTTDGVSTVGYWTITSTVSPVTTAAVTLYYLNSDGVSDAPNLRVVKDDGAGAWVDIGGTGSGSPTGSILSSTNFTTFSDFALANASGGGNVLPVELLYFKASLENESGVVLEWSTASELNNDFFQVEKSVDGILFNPIGKIQGSGTSSQVNRYSLIDKIPSTGLSFYRLKQVDFDGQFEYSPIVSINNDTYVGLEILLAPNPTTMDNIQFRVLSDDRLPLNVRLFDLTGRIFYEKSIYFSGSNNLIKIDAGSDLTSGMYLLRISQGANQKLVRIGIR